MYRDSNEAALFQVARLEHENAELKEQLTARKRRDTLLLWRVLGRRTKRFLARAAFALAAITFGTLFLTAVTGDRHAPASSANLSDAGVPETPAAEHTPMYAALCTSAKTEAAWRCHARESPQLFSTRTEWLCTPYRDAHIALKTIIGPMPTSK